MRDKSFQEKNIMMIITSNFYYYNIDMSVLFCKCVFCTGEENVVCTDYVYCVSCSVQYVLSFKDVLFDLFALNIFMQQHVGMLAF